METGAEADWGAVDFLVMGAGVAGLRASAELARHGDVLVVTKESLGESNTHYAQGGIAVAAESGEDVRLHLEDTVRAGDGLVYRAAAEAMVSEGPLRVAELMEWGANFDRAVDSGELRPGGRPSCVPARARIRWPAFSTPMATPPAPRSAVRCWLTRAGSSASALPSGLRSRGFWFPMAA
jgi:glycine/D-amino acid oxidase-like deaminating enzyme